MTLDSLIQETRAPETPPLVWPPELMKPGYREKTPHLSATQINMVRRCPEQFRRRYILGHKEAPAGALIWGSADHKAHEANFAQKVSSGTDISENDVKLAFAEAFDQSIERNGGPREIDWSEPKLGLSDAGDTKDRGVELVGAYHRKVSPRIQPLAVEERFEIAVAGVPVPVIGYVDVRGVIGGQATLFDGEPVEKPSRRLIERKTAKQRSSDPGDENMVQGLLYQAAFGLPVEWHQSVKTKTPAIYTSDDAAGLLLPFDARHVEQAHLTVRTTARKIASLYAEFGPDEPWPDNAGHKWACFKCGFRPTCAWWAYERAA